MIRSAIVVAGLALVGAMAVTAPANALTMKECSTKYEAAKSANSLNGMSWNDFRKAQCGADATPAAMPAAPAPAPAAPAPAPTTTMAKPKPVAVSGMFPSAIDPEFANGKDAKIKTCGKHWKALKAAGQTNGMKWGSKGGYWSQCAAALKGVK
ncbi:hypothetical protein GCM10007874_43660 [Labrys miyagiensis]|uniref:Antifreeze protein n=1 Tax=Labrys miyagiensis TaxID=346912 RepID=A0ABQ6CNQ5_9HYPH|nr:hypothetical protein [Labrys miyagiensis]GLS21349.1 hypothetical protein GCM10007874_43660 [Labrys miyagiensis]